MWKLLVFLWNTLANSMNSKFEVLFLEEARQFLKRLDEKTRIKILYNIDRAKILNDPKLFKKLTQDIWEFRTIYSGIQYRLLAFWDKTSAIETLVVSTHGFVKKVDRVSTFEIEKADKLRELYFRQE